jgi:hypothetical protein
MVRIDTCSAIRYQPPANPFNGVAAMGDPVRISIFKFGAPNWFMIAMIEYILLMVLVTMLVLMNCTSAPTEECRPQEYYPSREHKRPQSASEKREPPETMTGSVDSLDSNTHEYGKY